MNFSRSCRDGQWRRAPHPEGPDAWGDAGAGPERGVAHRVDARATDRRNNAWGSRFPAWWSDWGWSPADGSHRRSLPVRLAQQEMRATVPEGGKPVAPTCGSARPDARC